MSSPRRIKNIEVKRKYKDTEVVVTLIAGKIFKGNKVITFESPGLPLTSDWKKLVFIEELNDYKERLKNNELIVLTGEEGEVDSYNYEHEMEEIIEAYRGLATAEALKKYIDGI